MYYFENDPIQYAYDDLAKLKKPTHFDAVLKLKSSLVEAFNTEKEKAYMVETKRKSKSKAKIPARSASSLRPG